MLLQLRRLRKCRMIFVFQALYLLPPQVLPVASAALAGASNQHDSGLGLHVSLLARCMTRGSFGFLSLDILV